MPDTIPEAAAARPVAADPDRPLLIHVGYHKTGTTWLQNLVFLPDHGFHQAMEHRAVFDHLIHPHDLAFDPAPARAALEAGRAAAPAAAAVDVVSLEALSGLPFDGARESVSYARRLKAVAPEAKILFTVREQMETLASVYMQYVFRAGAGAPRDFFPRVVDRRAAGGGSDGYMRFDPGTFLYDRLVGYYQDLFGAANVMVLPLETIAADQGAAVRLLARFAGHDALAERDWTKVTERGRSYPQYAVPLLRRVNHLRRGAMNRTPVVDAGRAADALYHLIGGLSRRAPLPRRWTAAKPVSAHVRGLYRGFFADSNRRLAAMLAHPVDLSGYEGIDGPAP